MTKKISFEILEQRHLLAGSTADSTDSHDSANGFNPDVIIENLAYVQDLAWHKAEDLKLHIGSFAASTVASLVVFGVSKVIPGLKNIPSLVWAPVVLASAVGGEPYFRPLVESIKGHDYSSWSKGSTKSVTQ